jgi:hypothetical protein
MKKFNLSKEVYVEEINNVCDDWEVSDDYREKMITNITERIEEGEGFETMDGFYSYIDGYMQHM